MSTYKHLRIILVSIMYGIIYHKRIVINESSPFQQRAVGYGLITATTTN
jgi:hypothetical protein